MKKNNRKLLESDLMELAQISESLQRDAVWVVFLNVLLQQAGLPVPAVPTLLLAGSLWERPRGNSPSVLAAAIVASVVADWMWYLAGRAFGYRVLSGLCKLSINPGSCVSQTEARFVRWGLGSLVFAKFIPGFSTVAPPIAGSLRMRLPGFLLAAATGAALWAGLSLGAGWLLRNEVSGYHCSAGPAHRERARARRRATRTLAGLEAVEKISLPGIVSLAAHHPA